ncbi:MAG: cyclic beta 1-2 glucan synthetase [Verrucomicrobia bacterium]|nr:cyclic beta 1-2 glucan synthetase [Verrucomicrobiota bacterium]MBU1855404.1 cyclic beta 1-2 glucan synthetase [Verrucomicrobiota bacterium]
MVVFDNLGLIGRFTEQFRRWLGRPISLDVCEPPLRAELFGLEQFGSHGEALAAAHDLDPKTGAECLLPRLTENARVIRHSYDVVAEAVRSGQQMAPAAEWLLDNYYLIAEQIDIARIHLPKGYSRELPRLRTGLLRGFPRIYDLALELVSHTDGCVDADNVTHFVKAYQRVRPLKLGELWAIPIMLRLTLLENLRRVAYRIDWRRQHRAMALEWARRFVTVVQKDPRLFVTELADFVRANPPMSPPFIAELYANIEGVHSAIGLAVNWIEQELSQQGQTIELIQQAESQDQAADQVSIGNTITSLRTLNAIDWQKFVEALSVTEAVLCRDPAGIYPRMEFRTRDRYRHVVEDLAKKSGQPEEVVAETAIKLVMAHRNSPAAEPRELHVGYFLIDHGLPELQRAAGYRPGLIRRIVRICSRWPLGVYLLVFGGLTALLTVPLFLQIYPRLTTHWVWGVLAAGVILLAVSRSALMLTNWIITLLVPPRPLPRMDFSKGVVEDHRTAVVIPTLLYSEPGTRKLIEHLEICYLANREANLFFGILLDFPDAAQAEYPQEASLLDAAVEGIRQLNLKYATAGGSLFFLLYRPREWNPAEQVWMGHERKRGKLEAFNRLVCEGSCGPFTVIEGDLAILRSIKHVITLDADTQLPPQAAAKLAGTIAHPLNQPQINAATGCVKQGYGVLQPRLGASLIGSQRSWFARLFAGETGLDPYTRAVSNVYHDLCGEGPFVGKGIYDVQAFYTATGNRFPLNRILSHDLIEGCYARCGFVNDVELIEDPPPSYLADSRRHHRWIRGDWQIARWLLFSVPGPDGKRVINPLGTLAKWMILDNLRRSLVPAALLAAFILGGAGVLDEALRWTATLLILYFLPSLARAAYALLAKAKQAVWSAHLGHVLVNESRAWTIEGMELMFLPFQTSVYLDAILRVFWRLCISGRRLLEWQTAAEAARAVSGGLLATAQTMWIAPVVAIGTGSVLVAAGTTGWILTGPIMALWWAAPFVAWITGRPFGLRPSQLTSEQVLFLRNLARRTWAFFDHFIGPEYHWLPPDNFQEIPQPHVALRTSPTNMGMGLISTLAAYDFGYLSAGRLIVRIEQTLATMEKLERYRGHFYNWYDTQTLNPLHPLYVSTVDSGNLAGHLTTLSEGLRELPGAPMLPPHWREGLEDTTRILLEETDRLMAGHAESETGLRQMSEIRNQMSVIRRLSSAVYLPALHRALTDFISLLAELAPGISAADQAPPEYSAQARGATFWLTALSAECDDLLGELRYLAPWLDEAPPTAYSGTGKQDDYLWEILLAEITPEITLKDLATLAQRLAPRVDQIRREYPDSPRVERLSQLLVVASEHATERIESIHELMTRCEESGEMDVEFLYDPLRHLLSIGYSLETRRCDTGYYDLLASEARLCSFMTIARGQLPLDHWFHLGRQLAPGGGSPVLMSWSGSLFEYLMPLLVMPTFDNTLLDQACQRAIRRHIRYGRQHHIPWGFSESCYNQVDAQMTYQYRAFGVPGLGLKRGLADDLVVAPYASMMALMVAPREACRNLKILTGQGLVGRFGLYEAVDYTPSRLQSGERCAVIKTYMAHHSGMSLLALDFALNGQPMQRRFLSNPSFRSAILLLQERIPVAGIRPRTGRNVAETPDRNLADKAAETITRFFTTADTPIPEVHLLSNGRYHVMVTNAGGGYSRWQDLALTRWREDVTRDNWGTFFYIKDIDSGHSWSTTWQPLCQDLDRYDVTYSQGMAEFRAVKDQVEIHTRIAVSPEDDIELRRMIVTNLSRKSRTLELTSYAEVVLLEPRAEAGHPAYQGLFVQTELLPGKAAILCTRRPRSAEEHWPWIFHAVIVRDQSAGPVPSFETDRTKFIGRVRTPALPAALTEPGPLSNSAGNVLDPVVAVRRQLQLRPGESMVVDAILGIDKSREGAVSLVDKYHDHRLADRLFDVAWIHNQVLLHQLRLSESQAQLFGRIASSILYADSRRRASPSLIARNRKGQSGLWSYGVSGDLPIVLLRMSDLNNLDLARQLIHAYAYWRHKGLRVDLVIWAEAFSGYRQSLLDAIIGLVHGGPEGLILDQSGGIFVRNIDQVPEEDQLLIQSVARVIFSDRFGNLAEQLERRIHQEAHDEDLLPVVEPAKPLPEETKIPKRDLTFFNGLGGFTGDGREYVTLLYPGQTTPAPWTNVLANPMFGTVISESGGAYTWFTNAHEFRLTPWYNDPICDSSGEAFYIRDEDTGRFWSPTPGPARGINPYVCRHGLGYSVFEHTQDRLFTELYTYVGVEAPVKFISIKVRNLSDRTRRVSVAGFCEWVLGESRDRCAMHVVTRLDPQTGAIFARNAFNVDFPGHVAFFHCSEADRSLTGNRMEFIGRNGSPAVPEGLRRKQLSNRIGAGFDPCAAIQTSLKIPPGQQREVVFVLGAARNESEARSLLRSFSGIDGARQELEKVWQFWKHQLGSVYVETPDPSVNFLANHWLLYQVLTSRFWGRSGYYQSSGAYGFRDQLQDSLAFLYGRPWLTRQHLLISAGRQFGEGDVQHWWHSPSGRGIRTRISDDYLWLPYVACRYVAVTGDTGILDEEIPFLDARPLGAAEESNFDRPTISDQRASLYEHCVRAIKHGLVFGDHSLPLMQGGDWNDGMNRVGRGGKGESVWLAFFLYDVLTNFAALAARRGDEAMAQLCTDQAERLKHHIEAEAWDGRWYKRAFFDDGTPLGSAENPECRIDSLPQSWAVLSGAAMPGRGIQAMQSVSKHLVDRNLGVIKLFDPPFDSAPWDPGYIKGYIPGVRENGGQYTHAAVWTAMAWATLQHPDEAWECFTLLNPIRHADTPERAAIYKVEPYVMAADLYTAQGQEGRGGWTWYTGSAGWMYQLLVEQLLGLKLKVDRLTLAPLFPAGWSEYKIHYRYRNTFYHIQVIRTEPNASRVRKVVVDNIEQPDLTISLVDDRLEHFVQVAVGD